MKRIWRRICGSILCAIMMIGLFAPGAVALGEFTPADQIGEHFEADEHTGVLSEIPELAGDTSKSYANGWIKTDKTISAGENENEFLITLEVHTKAEIQSMALSEDAAAVIVIDLSGSMNDGQKLESAKSAALAFIEDFARTESAEALRKIAVVGFSGQQARGGGWWGSPRQEGIVAATTYQPWTDADDPSVSYAISNMYAEGGTCLQAGLILASNLLDSGEVAGISNKNIIVLTDGKPTYYLSGQAAQDRSTASIGEPDAIQGSGTDTDHNTHTQTEATAQAILSTGVHVYSIFLGDDTVTCNGRGCNLRKTGADWLRQDCGFVTYAVEEAGGLSDIFESISELIQLQARAWIAEDPMGDLFDFAGFEEPPLDENEYFYNPADEKVQWNLRLSTPDDTAEDGFSVYRLTYRVRLDTLAPGYRANRYYLTNGITSVTWLIEKSTGSGVSETDNGTAYFNVPSAMGYAADIRFRKTDGDGQPLAGAEFGLYHDGVRIETAVSTGHGDVVFENVPSGHSYTILEESAPEGFLASAERYRIEVSYGSLIGTIGTDNTVVNVPEAAYGGLTVSKTISGDGANPEDEFAFTVTLSDTEINGIYGDLAFTDGVARFTLKGGERATASGLPAGTGYTVTESDSKGYTVTVNGESKRSMTGVIETDQLAEIAFHNDKAGEPAPPPVGIDITKTVRATGDTIPDWENVFGFVISRKLPGETGEADLVAMPRITITGTGTDSVGYEFDNLDFSESDAATFYIWEAIGYEPYWNYDMTQYRVTFTKNRETGEVDRAYARITGFGDEAVVEPADEISFTNVYHYEDEPIVGTNGGDLTVSKTVSGGDRTKAFTFTVTLDDPEVNGKYGDMVFSDGVAVLQLKDGESATAEELPADVGYTVRESDNGGYTVTVNGTDSAMAEGIILEDETAVAAFHNEKIPDTGSVQVTKTVTGDRAPAVGISYSFNAWVRDGSESAVFESASYTLRKADGTIETGAAIIGRDGYAFSLKDGESILFSNITEGRQFEVQELTTGDFTTAVIGLTDGLCTISPNVTKKVEFVNDYGDDTPAPPIDTGSVNVTKTVTGDRAPAVGISYSFNAWVRGGSGSAVFESASYTLRKADGTIETGAAIIGRDGYAFSLKDGESILFSSITEGRQFEVQELTTGDFTTTVSGLSDGLCTISPNVTKKVEFVNDYGDDTPVPGDTPTPRDDTPVPGGDTPAPPIDTGSVTPPVSPPQPSKPDTPRSPQMGDSSKIDLWLTLACLSLFGLIVTLLSGKNIPFSGKISRIYERAKRVKK